MAKIHFPDAATLLSSSSRRFCAQVNDDQALGNIMVSECVFCYLIHYTSHSLSATHLHSHFICPLTYSLSYPGINSSVSLSKKNWKNFKFLQINATKGKCICLY